PIGGGGLIAGVAAALAAIRPDIRVVGVEAAGAPTMTASLEGGRCVRLGGVPAAVAGIRRDIGVVGVEAAGAPTMTASLEAGRCVRLERLHTMADGIALKSPSVLTLAHVHAPVAARGVS